MDYLFESDRMYFRRFSSDDAEAMYRLNLVPEVERYTGDPPFGSIEEARKFIEQYAHYNEHGYGRWAVVLKGNGEFIGWCGLKYHPTFIDLGYRLLKEYWGQGLATEAAIRCIEYGFNELDMAEIIGRSMPENERSVAVLKKAGMTYWKQDDCNDLHSALYFRIARQ